MDLTKIPYISVIVCIYNGEKTLKSAIESLLIQEYPLEKYEIILIDDGSKDDSSDICNTIINNYKNSSLKITYVYKENGGLSAARNTGIYKASGAIVAFIDQDAVADKKWVQKVVSGFSDDSIGVVGGRVDILNHSSLIARFVDIIRHNQILGPKYYQNQIIGTNMAYRKKVFRSVGGFFVEFNHRGDESAYLRLLLQHFQFSCAPEAIVYHERRDTLRKWFSDEFQEGKMSSLVQKVPSSYGKGIKYWLAYLENALIAICPIGIFLAISMNQYKWIAIIAIIPGILGTVRRHFLKPQYIEVRRRLKQEYRVPFTGVMYVVVDWITSFIRFCGGVVGFWVFRNTKISVTFPNNKKIRVTTTNYS